MNQTKPKPAKSKLALREIAQPLVRELDPDHPAARIFSAALSPVTHESPITGASPSTDESPSIPSPLALPDESPSASASPSTHDDPKPSLTPKASVYRKGDSRVNHDFFDERICGLEPLAQLLYFHLNRYRDSGSNVTVTVSWDRLASRIPVSESTLRRAFSRLQAAGLASKEREVYGKGSAQGIVFRVVTGASPSTHESPSTDDTHKRKALKENNKNESLALNPTNCPDCSGSGFYYPEGVERGVAKCHHTNLVP